MTTQKSTTASILDTQQGTYSQGDGVTERYDPDAPKRWRGGKRSLATTNAPVQDGTLEFLQDETAPRGQLIVLAPEIEHDFVREIKLQEWEGRVMGVSDDVFTAMLTDITASEDVEEEWVEFPMSDLTEDDKDVLRPGAIFRWIIGYRFDGGHKDRFGRIVFRRLPMWTEQEIDDADQEAERLFEAIDWHDRADSSNR